MTENKVTLEELRTRIIRGPLHAWMGVEVTDLTDDEVHFKIPYRTEMEVHPVRHYTHGGILATIIDMAADYAIMAKLGEAVPTIDIRVDYHRAAIQCDMFAKARVIKLGRVYTTAEAEVYDPDGKLLASGRGTFLTNNVGGG
jgi:uncharacterized protein (TIGR00369 family)